MQVFTLLKTLPKRILLSVYNTIQKLEQFHNNNKMTLPEIRESVMSNKVKIQQWGREQTTKFKGIVEVNILKYPRSAFGMYLIFWLMTHYLFSEWMKGKIKQFNGKGIIQGISYNIAETNKPFVMKAIKQKLFKNQHIINQITSTLGQLPQNHKVHQQLQAALSHLITTQFIKMNAAKLSIVGIQGQVMQKITQKQLKKGVIILLRNPYIRQQLKDIIIDYLRGKDFEHLVISQLANLVQMSMTQKLLAELVQSTFNSVIADPYPRYLILEGIKDYLI